MLRSSEPVERESEVVIYHDEIKSVQGTRLCGHVLLFVPRRMKVRHVGGLFEDFEDEQDPGALLLAELRRIRSEYRVDSTKFHFTQISGAKWTIFDRGTYEYLAAGVDALRTRSCARFPFGLHCKVATIFYPVDADPPNYGGDRKERQYRYDETALRMRLKGVLNGLYGPTHRVRVLELISDGVAAHRPLDVRRVLLQVTADELVGRTALRDHVEIAEAARITPVASDHKMHAPGSPEDDHAHLLQLADLFLGSFARAAYGTSRPFAVPPPGTSIPGRKKDVVMGPTWDLLSKQSDGRLFGSSHRGSYSASELVFKDGAISFKRKSSPNPVVTRRERGSTTARGCQFVAWKLAGRVTEPGDARALRTTARR